jgi:hypothetical protein
MSKLMEALDDRILSKIPGALYLTLALAWIIAIYAVACHR